MEDLWPLWFALSHPQWEKKRSCRNLWLSQRSN